MNKSVIVYGLDMAAMRKYADRIVAHLGMKRAEFWPAEQSSKRFKTNDSVIFWEGGFAPVFRGGNAAHSLCKVADDINAAIPLTDWQSGPPPMVGEWNASYYEADGTQRWWNGELWSFAWSEKDQLITANERASIRISERNSLDVRWRGLSQEPITIEEVKA